MASTFIVRQLAELPGVAAQISNLLHHPVCLFQGSMGVGKTTLIQSLCRHWGVQEAVQSPTYQLVNEYIVALDHTPVYHFDFYRLKTAQEALAMGLEEYLYSGYFCLIEWPQKIIELWPDDFHLLEMECLEDGQRRITVKTTSDE